MDKIEILLDVSKKDLDSILETWESAVRASHSFLSEKDIDRIRPQVIEAVKFISRLIVVRDDRGNIKAFMGIEENKIEMLFVRDNDRGKGIGRLLVNYGINNLSAKYVDVNEDNIGALAFYEHMGFEVFKRSELDSSGDPFPILSMLLKQEV